MTRSSAFSLTWNEPACTAMRTTDGAVAVAAGTEGGGDGAAWSVVEPGCGLDTGGACADGEDAGGSGAMGAVASGDPVVPGAGRSSPPGGRSGRGSRTTVGLPAAVGLPPDARIVSGAPENSLVIRRRASAMAFRSPDVAASEKRIQSALRERSLLPASSATASRVDRAEALSPRCSAVRAPSRESKRPLFPLRVSRLFASASTSFISSESSAEERRAVSAPVAAYASRYAFRAPSILPASSKNRAITRSCSPAVAWFVERKRSHESSRAGTSLSRRKYRENTFADPVASGLSSSQERYSREADSFSPEAARCWARAIRGSAATAGRSGEREEKNRRAGRQRADA